MLRRNADAYADTGTPLGCMIVLAATNLGRGHEHVGHLLADLRAQDLAKVTERIERGLAEGDVPEGVDAPALASYLVTVSQGMALRARDGCTAREAHTVVDAAMTAYDAITAGAGPAI
ncbi:hypothetical protein ABZ635_12545 [Nocardiopsis sp. NPDC007018]|uniref:TetR family transcriptional regulator C-terminal domain-containing protein n=1 Tax=Nocardiopsis sp. NPDC007018 TaxID=3155721 RepID=UPI00340E046B